MEALLLEVLRWAPLGTTSIIIRNVIQTRIFDYSTPWLVVDHSFDIRLAIIILKGIPHRLTTADVYKGYSIPKGTIVFANHL